MIGAFMRISKYLGTDLGRHGMSVSFYGDLMQMPTPRRSLRRFVWRGQTGDNNFIPHLLAGGGKLFEYVYTDLRI